MVVRRRLAGDGVGFRAATFGACSCAVGAGDRPAWRDARRVGSADRFPSIIAESPRAKQGKPDEATVHAPDS